MEKTCDRFFTSPTPKENVTSKPHIHLIFSVSTDACDPPFEMIEGGCYYCNPDLFVSSYDTATEFCADQGGVMAVVKSGNENRAIIQNLLASPRLYP